MPAPGWSLRNRLTGLLIALALLAWGLSSAWLYRSAVVEADRLFDAALVETGHAVLAVADREIRHRGRGRRHQEAGDDDDEVEIELAPIDHIHGERVFYQVRRPGGEIVYRSPGAPQAPLASALASGFSDRQVEGVAYRVFSLQAGRDGASIDVAQPVADRARLSHDSALRLVLPGALLVLLLTAGVGVLVRRVTRPVVRFSAAIDARDPTSGAPVTHGELPRELQPVGVAVNRLLARVQEALRHERTLTADAAHELRTPLAALRAQAQVALRAQDEAERSEALRALVAGVDRATHMVSAVLTLAQLDSRELDLATLPPTELTALARQVAEEYQPTAAQRAVRIDLQLQPCATRADADALVILLRNLVDNAIKHARSTVRIAVGHAAGRARVVVSDDGAGLAPAQSDRVFDRFYRGDSTRPGAGLGLALVRRIAELHGGRVEVDRGAEGGARFTVLLGPMLADGPA